MKKIEKYHYEEVKEIERLFEKKLRQEGDGYLQLEQEGLEMKQRFENQIKQIKQENQDAINGLLEEFKVNLYKVNVEHKESVEFSDKLKDYYAKKLEKQEQTHEEEVMDLKLKFHEEGERKRREVQQQQEKLQRKTTKKDSQMKEMKKVQKFYQDAQQELDRVRLDIEKL